MVSNQLSNTKWEFEKGFIIKSINKLELWSRKSMGVKAYLAHCGWTEKGKTSNLDEFSQSYQIRKKVLKGSAEILPCWSLEGLSLKLSPCERTV